MNTVTIEKTGQHTLKIKGGTLWQHEDGEVYILAKLNHNAYCLICLEGGTRWTEPKESIEGAFGTSRRYFTQITTGTITITPKP